MYVCLNDHVGTNLSLRIGDLDQQYLSWSDWDLETKTQIAVLKGHTDNVYAVCVAASELTE
jgi:hypothetical protein